MLAEDAAAPTPPRRRPDHSATQMSCRVLKRLCLLMAIMPIAVQTKAAEIDYDALLRRKDYLEVSALIASDHTTAPADRRYIEGIIANRRGDSSRSTRLLEPLVRSGSLKDVREQAALHALADSYAKAGAYSKAADAYIQLLRRFGPLLSDRLRQSLKGNASLFEILRNTPPQTNGRMVRSRLRIKVDPVGLSEIPVRLNGRREEFIVDTGANECVVARSIAEKLGLNISASTVPFEGIGGELAEFHVAVLPRLDLGNSVFRNVVLLVTDDENLFVNAARFQIRGIIGFPIVSKLGSLKFTSNQLDVGAGSSMANWSSLYLDDMTILVAASDFGGFHLYALDTGSVDTVFSARYAELNADMLVPSEPGVRYFSGFGGIKQAKVLKHVKTTLILGGASVNIRDLDVLSEPVGADGDDFFGIIGLDVLSRFSSYTIDFKHMRFSADKSSHTHTSRSN